MRGSARCSVEPAPKPGPVVPDEAQKFAATASTANVERVAQLHEAVAGQHSGYSGATYPTPTERTKALRGAGVSPADVAAFLETDLATATAFIVKDAVAQPFNVGDPNHGAFLRWCVALRVLMQGIDLRGGWTKKKQLAADNASNERAAKRKLRGY